VEGWSGASASPVRGTLEQPVATGIATVNNATISAQALPELPDVTGTVQFNRDRIQVEGVQVSSRNVQARGNSNLCQTGAGRS